MSRRSTDSGSACCPDGPAWSRPSRFLPAAGRLPWLALVLAGAVLVAAVVTGSLWHDLPDRFAGGGSFGWPALQAGRWWTLASSLVLTRDAFMALTMAAAVAVGLGAYEWLAGPGRALAVALVGHVTGSVVVALGAGALGRTGWPVAERAAANLDYGASMVVAAALGAIASRSRDRRMVRLALFGPPLILLLHHQLADWAHLFACPAGYVVDGARRPRPAALAAFATAALTGWLVLYGPTAVVETTAEIRFATAVPTPLPTTAHHGRPTPSLPSGGSGLATVGGSGPATAGDSAVASRSGRLVPAAAGASAEGSRPKGRIERLAYTARALGDRPEVATVYVPAGLDQIVTARARLPVVLFLHGIPGAPEDWLAGGGLAGRLDDDIAAGRFPVALAVVPESSTMHDPKAGWLDAPHQPVLQSLVTDLLPAVGQRFPSADLDRGRVAVVGVGGGADGALRLARADRRFGYAVAIGPTSPDLATVVGSSGAGPEIAGADATEAGSAAGGRRTGAGSAPEGRAVGAGSAGDRRATATGRPAQVMVLDSSPAAEPAVPAGTPAVTRGHHRGRRPAPAARRHWAQWRADLPAALRELTAAGFGRQPAG
jgi:enterochelin esterase-like enzyme